MQSLGDCLILLHIIVCSLSFLLFRFSEQLATVELFQTRKYNLKTIELGLFQRS